VQDQQTNILTFRARCCDMEMVSPVGAAFRVDTGEVPAANETTGAAGITKGAQTAVEMLDFLFTASPA